MKTFKILRHRKGKTSEIEGTLPELIERFSYTLEKGKSWERERGNKKINMNPKTIKSLVSNLNNAVDNAAANGYSEVHYELV